VEPNEVSMVVVEIAAAVMSLLWMLLQ